MMTIQEIYNLAIELGIKNDFRTKKEIEAYLERKKDEYAKLSKDEQRYFDKERLTNPYADSRIHNDNGTKKIKKVLAGIDISVGGLILARELGVDLVINHHPVGLALSGLDAVMDLQIEVMEKIGVPVNIAEKMIHKRISEVTRGINPINHYVTVDAAKLLKVNLINVHTPADNLVAQFITKLIENDQPRYVGEILEVLERVPEYQEAKRQGAGPILFSGDKKNRAGRIVASEITGGTEGSKEIYQAMANAGVGTIIGMHQSEEHRKAAEDAHINVVIAGHISSDSIGMNLFLDELEKKDVEVVSFAGLIRYSRNKKK
ncbi:MAG: NGG1p interacting factor NIF3 [Candidatus Moraniibacteriota bacterium]|jgi:putative NIF3 family GTP cyclohydrolase 1 type 2